MKNSAKHSCSKANVNLYSRNWKQNTKIIKSQFDHSDCVNFYVFDIPSKLYTPPPPFLTTPNELIICLKFEVLNYDKIYLRYMLVVDRATVLVIKNIPISTSRTLIYF